MRTTLTLDPDVARLLEEAAHRQRKSFKQVVNEALRRGLAPAGTGPRSKPYKVVAHVTSLCPGVDAGAFNRLADGLEEEDGEVYSNDHDFGRFEGVRWVNPLA
jgi:hypothetical protein